MKKFIAIGALAFVLFALVAPELAFAKPGDKVKFAQAGHEDDVKVTNVTQTANGIEIEYKGLKTMAIGLFFFIVANYKDGTTNDDTNHESAIIKDKTYSFKMKTDRQPSEITMVNVSLGKSKNEAQESLLLPVAAKILDIGSNLPDLEGMCLAYSTLVSSFDKIGKWKDRISFLRDGYYLYNDFQNYKELKAQGSAGSAETARRDLVKRNLKFVESVAGGSMNAIQGTLLTLAVDGVSRVVDILNARYDYYSFLSDVGQDDTDLCEEPFVKYASIGVQMLADGKSVDEVRDVFIALNTLATQGKNDNYSASERAKNTAKTKGRVIDFKQFNYQDSVSVAVVVETKNGIGIRYTGKKTIKKVVFLARCKYNDGKTRDYYNSERGITKNIPWFPKMKTDFPSSINFVTVYIGTSKADVDKIAAADKPAPTPTRAEYQKIIQGYCKFGNAADVWKVIDQHKNADDVYRIWANSYPNPLLASRPSGKTDKDIIQERCKFGTPQAVWDVIAKHKNANDVLKAWADSYYKGLRK